MPRTTAWLPTGWQHPARLDLPTGHHLRPIRPADVDLHLCAVMGSWERLWSVLGAVRGWPPETLTVEEDRRDLAGCEAASRRQESFTYALLDVGETELLGRVHVERARKAGADGDVWWWVVDHLVGGPVEAALADAVPRWVADRWPLARPRFVGRDLTWAEWSALPDGPDRPGGLGGADGADRATVRAAPTDLPVRAAPTGPTVLTCRKADGQVCGDCAAADRGAEGCRGRTVDLSPTPVTPTRRTPAGTGSHAGQEWRP